MARTRILIVDDSVVARRLLVDALSVEPSLQVCDMAASGPLALAKIPQCNPNVITLDVHMPEMSGLETLAAIRKTYPRLPVIMVSSLTERGAQETLDALSLGANDYVTKPSNVKDRDHAIERLRQELIPKIKVFSRALPPPVTLAPADASAPPALRHLPAGHIEAMRRVDVVAIGVSTGGPNALADVLGGLPADFPVPLVIVQHMPPIFTRFLAERLSAKTPIQVREAQGEERLVPGQAFLAPGDFHMTVKRLQGAQLGTAVHKTAPENSCRPSVDVLFRSVADAYGANSLAVIMTGMGQDGFRGCERLSEAGAQILAQDQASSVVWGMPGFVANAGLAEKVLPLDRIAEEITRRVHVGRAAFTGQRSAREG